ncbi:MAG: 50S ribosomal protein L22 [Planctomycetes bacterium]|nr:50S ribosomal protein L22 [Planctomycetota bacterium]MBT6453058.1 50S ribosomal protein L22 [Planctomycetota bacterium]MBT6541112.1 50S ribosomal protein L22 [Planctomycetota bacterium]MBT6785043.1 50S ribosomal protein L22 [Planctomycetota bacterium]MBT6968102.1 50S ribosomal protein L22 [Planctomycetota bacterium]
MEYKASHKYARITARKARYVVDQVRNMPVEGALDMLKFSDRRAAPMIAKVIKSALHNAIQEGGANPENLVIWRATINEGPTMKRWRPRARGMAFPILKRSSHINIILADRGEAGVAAKKGS